MSKQTLSMSEIIESHKPKNFKYRFIITDDSVYEELNAQHYDLNNLDTINDDQLVQEALKAEYKYFERDVIKRAKEPTVLDDGVILSKKMVTKADKKLQKVGTGFFRHNDVSYVAIKLVYERFDIIEIFIMT